MFLLVLACGAPPPDAKITDTDTDTDTDSDTDADTDSDTDTDSDSDTDLPTGTPDGDEVRINETILLVTLDGVGANAYNFPYAGDAGWDPAVVVSVFDELAPPYIRLAPWFNWWESENDNNDPLVMDPAGFQSELAITDWHDVPFAQFLAGRGIEPALGIWDVGDWLAGGAPRAIDPEDYDELGESIAAYLAYLRDAGVEIPVAEVQNEPGIEAGIQYASAEDLRDAALVVLDQLDHFGLGDTLLHGPNFHTPTGAADWAEVWFADEHLRERSAALSYHTWWSDDPADYESIRSLGEDLGVPIWATEVGYCALASGCFGGTNYLLPETWGTAWDTAWSLYRAIAWSHASRVYHWTAVGWDAVVSPTGERYPTWYVLRHFTQAIPPGAELLETACGEPDVSVLAFRLPGGSVSAVLLNGGDTTHTLRLSSVSGLEWRFDTAETSVDGTYAAATVFSAADESVTLPPQSVTTVVLAVD